MSVASRSKKMAASVVAVVAAVMTLSQAPAMAHYIYQWSDVATTGNMCVRGRAEISHGSGGGYSKGDVQTRTADPQWAPCSERPFAYVYQHAIQLQVDHWDGQVWQRCMISAWQYRTGSVAQSYVSWNYSIPCGPGYYTTWSNSVARATADDWGFRGGWAGTAGYHLLPA